MSVVSKGRLITAAILAIFVYGMIASVAGTIVPDVSKRFGLTPEQIGNVFLAQAIGLIIASVSVGPLLDNRGKKTGLLLGFILIAIALFAIPNSSGYDMMMIFMLILGVGGGIIVTAANALVSDISEERRASTLNLLNLFFTHSNKKRVSSLVARVKMRIVHYCHKLFILRLNFTYWSKF